MYCSKAETNLNIILLSARLNGQWTVFGLTLDHGVDVVKRVGLEHKNVNVSLRFLRMVPMENPVWVRQQKSDLAVKKAALFQKKNWLARQQYTAFRI